MQTADGAHLTDADVTAVGESGVTDWPWASTLERSTYYGHDEVFVYVHNKRDVVSTQWVSDNSRQLLVRDFRQAVVGEIVCHSGVASTNAAAVTRAEMCGPVQDLGAAGGVCGARAMPAPTTTDAAATRAARCIAFAPTPAAPSDGTCTSSASTAGP
ncbi:MAG: hypothetical protein GY708_08070 [Actinomycetia bacterium]|nr:hypothetical protein [Actinomycetes bacterium]